MVKEYESCGDEEVRKLQGERHRLCRYVYKPSQIRVGSCVCKQNSLVRLKTACTYLQDRLMIVTLLI